MLTSAPVSSFPSGPITGTSPSRSAAGPVGARAARLADAAEPGHAIGVDDAIGKRDRREAGALEGGAQLSGDGRQALAHAGEHRGVGEAAAADEARLDAAPRASALICAPPPCTTQMRASRAMRATCGHGTRARRCRPA